MKEFNEETYFGIFSHEEQVERYAKICYFD